MSAKYIQKAKECHVNNIFVIENESYTNPWNKKHIVNDINHLHSLNYIYEENKELIGYLFGYLIKNEYHLNKITVKESYRRKKIGKLLFYYCVNQLLNNNVKSIQLEVSSLNLIAQKFYRSLGFIKVGMRKKYYSNEEDALLYNLEL